MRGGKARSMNKEEMFDYYGQPDDGGFIRLHAYDLQQLIRNGNASYSMLSDINKLGKALLETEKDRDYWKHQADTLAELIRALSRNTSFLEYERERQQRIHGRDND